MEAEDPVLIALVSRPRDMDLVRSEHWYRIPVTHAPRQVAQARYLAFYLTGAFGEDRWSVREYALVRGHELVRRKDLLPGEPDHPRAQDAYLKIQLGPLLRLPHPILSRSGRRMLFIWTTGARFSSAVELNDLLSTGHADDLLWAQLQAEGISAERHVIMREGRIRYRVDYWIACAMGDLAIFLGDTPRRSRPGSNWHRLCFSEEEITQELSRCSGQIIRAVRDLGNPKYTSEHSL